MYEVKENDLKLSKKYLGLQAKLDQKKFELIEQDKKVNDQTIEACLLFQSNVEYYKDSVKNLKYFDRKDSIVRTIHRAFPESDVKFLEKEINKVIISEKVYCYFIATVFTILYFITIFIINLIFTFNFHHIFQYYLPLLCFFILMLVFVDSYIRD